MKKLVAATCAMACVALSPVRMPRKRQPGARRHRERDQDRANHALQRSGVRALRPSAGR